MYSISQSKSLKSPVLLLSDRQDNALYEAKQQGRDRTIARAIESQES
jgi:PleD family two-component response regulator